MKPSVDASVLWSVIKHQPDALDWRVALEAASRVGDLVICEVAFAEIASAYPSADVLLHELERLTISFDPIHPAAAWKAGQTYKAYRKAGGPRGAMIPDFLIAAHAQVQADRLATADRAICGPTFLEPIRQMGVSVTQASCLFVEQASSLPASTPAGRMPAGRTAWKAVLRFVG